MENIETLLAAVAQTQGFDDDDEPAVSAAPERGLENSESSPVVPGDARPSAVVDMPPPAPMPEFPASGRVIGAGEKRKRGRPSKEKLAVKPPPCKRNKQEDEEEDVCFICFDGGSLVLCDRKGCPKAYHPTCIKRDEAFFKSKAKWNCGWHICSVCRKASYYMCYTCTYSLCKGCTKDADYVRVRGHNGFCSTCMKTIMLIEDKGQTDNGVEVDFDDQTSWEYLFKMYWVILKEKLSLALNELTRAKNPWKGVAPVPVGYKPMSSNVIPAAVSEDLPTTHTRTDHLELKKPVEINLPLPNNCCDVEKLNIENGGDGPAKPSVDEVMQVTSVDKEATDEPGIEKDQDDLNTTKDTDKTCICKNTNSKKSENPGIFHSTEWAKKDLLEFVAHIKNGDMTAISRFDVQTLLLDYINNNSLWDPCRKSQIICDPWLEKLFGKPRVDNAEMLKLLESHFLVKEDSQKDSFIPAGFVSPVKCNMEVDEIEEDSGSGENSKKDEYVKSSYSVFPQNGRKHISPIKGKEETESGESNSSDKHTNQIITTNLDTDGKNDQNDMPSSGLETPTTTASVGNSPSSNIMEIEKLWHYRDPNGKIRGPFSLMQLREFNATGLYLPDTRIWTNHEQYDSLLLTDALNGKFHGASDFSNSGWREEGADGENVAVNEATNVSSGDSEQIEKPTSNGVLSENNNTGVVRADESGSWPQCWDFLKGSNNSSGDGAQARNLLHSSSHEKKHEALPDCGQESNDFYHGSQNGEIISTGLTQNPITGGCGVQNEDNNEDQMGISSEENSRSLNIDLGSDDLGPSKSPDSNKHGGNIPGLNFPSPIRPNTDENRHPVPSDAPMQNFGFLELLSPAPRCNNEDQACQAFETKNSGFLNFPMPNSSQVWNGASCLGVSGVQIPDLADDWCGISSAFSLKPPEITCGNIVPSSSDGHHQLSPSHSNIPNWLANINEPIEFDALGEESVSDLLAEVDAMESQGPLYSPNSAIKFAREFLEDCKDDCFSSIEEFSSSTPELRKSDGLSSTSYTQLNSQSCKPINVFDSLTRPNVHAPVSSEVETNTAGLEFHLHAPNAGQDVIGAAMGNINLVTVQGNVNLVLGGPGSQGMADLGWGTNSGTGWVNPNLNLNCGPANSSLLPWDGGQRKYNGERYTSPREWGYQGGRPPWGRQPPPSYGGGGYSRPIVPKGQRVCKFFESGRCKKGAFCDYLHT